MKNRLRKESSVEHGAGLASCRQDLWQKAMCLLLFLAGCAAPHQMAPSPTAQLPVSPTVGGVLTHRVGPQESLWSIGKRYGVSYREIMQANHLSDPTQVPIGRLLLIPRPFVPSLRVPLFSNPRWTYIVIHHSGTRSGNARLFDRIHRKRGFSNGLGYHFLIDNGTLGRQDGQIEIGPRWMGQKEGAHCNAGGMNQSGIGICLVGDFTHQQPSQAQMNSLVALVRQLCAYYDILPSHVIRHRDVPGKRTACPGDDFPWDQFRRHL